MWNNFTLVICAFVQTIAACKDRKFISSGDNYQWIYIEGLQVGYSGDWRTTLTVIVPYTATILAVQITDADNQGGFLGSFSDGSVTDSSWKCTPTFFNGWNTSHFDDSTWPYATTKKKKVIHRGVHWQVF